MTTMMERSHGDVPRMERENDPTEPMSADIPAKVLGMSKVILNPLDQTSYQLNITE